MNPPTPNRDEAERFLTVLDPNAASFTFQTFDDVERRSHLARILHGSLAQHFETLQQLNTQGAGIFITVNETDGKGRSAENITRVRAQFVDLDGAPLEPVLQAKLPPHIVVESSPNRWHAYWLVENAQLNEFRAIQKALIERFNSDPAVKDLPRCMRLPGFLHRKSEPFLVRIESTSDAAPYQAAVFELPKEQAGTQRTEFDNTTTPPNEANPEAVAEYQELLSAVDPDVDYNTWWSICCALVNLLGFETGKRIAIEWSAGGRKFKRGELERKLNGIDAKQAYGYGRKTIVEAWALAAEAQMSDKERADLEQSVANIVANAKKKQEQAAQPNAKPTKKNDWPTLDEAAYHGLVGEATRMIMPHTEADPVAILLQILAVVGNLVGRTCYFVVESTKHHANLFIVLAGDTAKARKGTSFDRVKAIFEIAYPQWVWERNKSGLSSGEGLIYEVRDPIMKWNTKTNAFEQVDPGAADKRLLIVEPEFAGALSVIDRHGNTLSPLLRKAWDGGMLQTMTRNSPLAATGAQISIIGHITVGELRAKLTQINIANGLANRFLYALVKRARELPFGGTLKETQIQDMGAKFKEALGDLPDNAATHPTGSSHQFTRTKAADAMWGRIYSELSSAKPGLFGALIARAEAQTMRLAMIYAILDGKPEIDVAHLQAALAVWRYCEASAKHIFGDATGDETVDRITEALRNAGAAGLSRNTIRELFGRHEKSATIAAALADILARGVARCVTQATAGRPTEMWFAVENSGGGESGD